MMMLYRTISISALLLCPAYAQQTPPLPGTNVRLHARDGSVATQRLRLVIRAFSDGAGFCIADKVLQTCTIGKWSREISEGCRGALADTR